MFNKQDWEIEISRAAHIGVNIALAALVMVVFWVALRSPADGQSAPDGAPLFQKRCTGCHALDTDREGPRLRGVVGRPVGSVKTFNYSEALKNAKYTWDETNLEKWLADTESVVPDNDMAFRVPNQEERIAIVAYLKSLCTP